MSSLVTAVFIATIGLLVKRHEAAERLKEGDVTDQKFRGFAKSTILSRSWTD